MTSPAPGSRSVPEHGTAKRYRHGPDINDQLGKGCRCTPCTEAQAADLAAYRQRKAREQWGTVPKTHIDAEPVRQHVRALMAAGIGWERVAELAGVAKTTVAHLLYGSAKHEPAKRMRSATAQKILAVTVEGNIADGQFVDAIGTRRRLQALVVVGWTGSELMRRLGRRPTNFGYLLNNQRVLARTAQEVKQLYNALWDSVPPQTTREERGAFTQAIRTAEKRGWLPPAAWDDDLIDLPEDELAAELARLAAAMDDQEAARCWTARYKHGDQSMLAAAGAREHRRRKKEAANGAAA